MGTRKRTYAKVKIIREGRRAEAIPAWVMAKTKGRVRFSHRRRHWRRGKLKI